MGQFGKIVPVLGFFVCIVRKHIHCFWGRIVELTEVFMNLHCLFMKNSNRILDKGERSCYNESKHLHGGDNLDETSQKIIDATMTLVRDKGYVATTTKEIAKVAGVNECTLFRKFKSKKDIVLQGVNQAGWRANVTQEIFENVQWDLQADIEMFMRAYMDRMTPDFVNLSIALRAPQLYEETASLIMKVPQAFLSSFTEYLNKMYEMGKIPEADFDALAMAVFASTFGYTFLRASFGKELSKVEKDEYIKNSAQMFIKGLEL